MAGDQSPVSVHVLTMYVSPLVKFMPALHVTMATVSMVVAVVFDVIPYHVGTG